MHSLELTHVAAVETKDALAHLASLPGVSFAALMDCEGFLIDHAGHIAADAEAVSALASSLLESSEKMGRELGQRSLRYSICEFDEGLVLAMGTSAPSRLVVVLHDVTALDAARRSARDMLAALPCTL